MDRRNKNIRNSRLASVRQSVGDIDAYYASESLYQHSWRAIRRCRLERQSWKSLDVWRERVGIVWEPHTLHTGCANERPLGMSHGWLMNANGSWSARMIRQSSRPTHHAQAPQLARRLYCNAQTENNLGAYNTVGTAGVPGGRYGAATWTDAAGNLWMFGGNGLSSSSRGLLNDLWEFNASTYYPASYR